MKKFLILLGVLIGIGVALQFDYKFGIDLSKRRQFNKELEDLDPYFEQYASSDSELTKRAQNIIDFMDKYYKEVPMHGDIKVYTYKGSKIDNDFLSNLGGFAYGMYSYEVKIYINETVFNRYNWYEQQELLRHELMHDIYNITHSDDKTSVMYKEQIFNEDIVSMNKKYISERKFQKGRYTYYNNMMNTTNSNYQDWWDYQRDRNDAEFKYEQTYRDYEYEQANYWRDQVKAEGLKLKLKK